MTLEEIISKNTDFINNLGKESTNFRPDGTSIFTGLDFWTILLMIVLICFALAILIWVVSMAHNRKFLPSSRGG